MQWVDGTTQYLYGNLSNPFQVTASRNPGNVLTVYYYDDFGALYALERGGARYYVGSDHLGTPKVVTDNTGTIVRQVEYDSWGVKIGDTNPSFDMSVGFAGGIPDDATGLVRFGFRDYEPATGRWAAKDPIFFRGGQLNLFVYALNDPVNRKDTSGLCPLGSDLPPDVDIEFDLTFSLAGINYDSFSGQSSFDLLAGSTGVSLTIRVDPPREGESYRSPFIGMHNVLSFGTNVIYDKNGNVKTITGQNLTIGAGFSVPFGWTIPIPKTNK